MLSLLNDPFAIALSNALRYQEVLRRISPAAEPWDRSLNLDEVAAAEMTRKLLRFLIDQFLRE